MTSVFNRFLLLTLLCISAIANAQSLKNEDQTTLPNHRFHKTALIYTTWVEEKTALGELDVKNHPDVQEIEALMSAGYQKQAKLKWLEMTNREQAKLSAVLKISVKELDEFIRFYYANKDYYQSL